MAKLEKWLKPLVLVLACLGLLFFYYPNWFPNLQTHFIGEKDVNIYIFNAFNAQFQIAQGANILETSRILFPFELSMIAHTHTLGMSLFSMLFEQPIQGINIFLLLHFVLSFIGAFYWAQHFLKNNWFSVLCAFIFAFSPYKTMCLTEHYNLVLTGFLPWFCLFFERSFQLSKTQFFPYLKSLPNFLLMLLMLACSLVCGYVVSFIALMYIPIRIFGYWLNRLKLRTKNWLFFLLALLVCLGLDQLYQFLNRQDLDGMAGFYWSADLLNLFIPENLVFYKQHYFSQLQERYIHSSLGIEAYAFLSFTLIALFLIGIWARQTRGNHFFQFKGFSLILLFFLCFPAIKFAGERIVYSPTAFLHFLPYTEQMRNPVRYMTLLPFFLALWSSGAILELDRFKWFKKPYFPLALLALMLIEMKPKEPNLRLVNDGPEIFTELKGMPDGALLQLPFGLSSGNRHIGKMQKDQLRQVAIHEKRLLGGHLSRVPEYVFEYYQSNQFIQALVVAEQTGNLPSFNMNEMQVDFEILEIDYILVPNRYRGTASHNLLQILMGSNYELHSDAVDQLYVRKEGGA